MKAIGYLLAVLALLGIGLGLTVLHQLIGNLALVAGLVLLAFGLEHVTMLAKYDSDYKPLERKLHKLEAEVVSLRQQHLNHRQFLSSLLGCLSMVRRHSPELADVMTTFEDQLGLLPRNPQTFALLCQVHLALKQTKGRLDLNKLLITDDLPMNAVEEVVQKR